MLVRLTFVKRFGKDGFLYRKERVYSVDEDRAIELTQIMVNDMPIFKLVKEDDLTEADTVIYLTEEEDEPVAVQKPKPAKKTVVKKKAAIKKKTTIKSKAKVEKSADEPQPENVEMV